MGQLHGGRGRQAQRAVGRTGPRHGGRRQWGCRTKSRDGLGADLPRKRGGVKHAVNDDRRALQVRLAGAA
jgi:hypothetical protein